ncbi:hypothetical protein KTR66_20895 [Roseococcus sp. SDR]|uniref:hypothetical protein n=1 Tax=Roseococcus sp. SDR TaxID=2835532 RepID=UPI001BCDDA08|nr:hypothetical protein [Roseococcus sp. SDR]MBS7792463.1 hypothetical protein [Roseococcus sp. SDR]MBV1847777.1 hypothetical protein [Roseococcus sp. SDR]
MEILDWRDERILRLAAQGFVHFVAVSEAAAAYRKAIDEASDERPRLAALGAAQLCRWQAHAALTFHAADGRTLTDIEVCEGLACTPSDAPREAGLLSGVPIESLVARVRQVSQMHLATRPLTDALVEDMTTRWEALRYAVAQLMVAKREARP